MDRKTKDGTPYTTGTFQAQKEYAEEVGRQLAEQTPQSDIPIIKKGCYTEKTDFMKAQGDSPKENRTLKELDKQKLSGYQLATCYGEDDVTHADIEMLADKINEIIDHLNNK